MCTAHVSVTAQATYRRCLPWAAAVLLRIGLKRLPAWQNLGAERRSSLCGFQVLKDFSRDARLDLTALCGRCIFDAAYDHGISTYFAGARQMRKFETVEWAEIL
jgi:hypothetical protein